MAQLWGDEATQQNISYACKKLGITRKKTYGYQERDEEKRVEFREKLEKIANNRKIYVDEAGFDNREDYPYGSSLKGERSQALKSGKRTERVIPIHYEVALNIASRIYSLSQKDEVQ